MATKTSNRPVRSWAALAQALVAAPKRWVVGAPDDRRRVRRYANAASAPRGRRAHSAAATPREGVSYFVPNLRFFVLLAVAFGVVLGGLTGGALGWAFAGSLAGDSSPRSAEPSGRALLQASVGQTLETDGLKLAVVSTATTDAAVLGQAIVQITLAYARGLAQPRLGLWTADGAWSVSSADFGLVAGAETTPLEALRDSNGVVRSWLAAGEPAGWVTLTAQVPCGTAARLEYDPAPFAGGPRLQFALPLALCAAGSTGGPDVGP